MQCWVGTCIREWWPMVPTQKNCTWGHQSRAPKSSFCCQPSAGRLRAHFDENLFCRTTTQSEDRTQECSRATHRTTWGSGGGEKKVVGGCGGCGGVVRLSGSSRSVSCKNQKRKKKHATYHTFLPHRSVAAPNPLPKRKVKMRNAANPRPKWYCDSVVAMEVPET